LTTSTNGKTHNVSKINEQIKELVNTGFEAIDFIHEKVRMSELNFNFILHDLNSLCLSVEKALDQINLNNDGIPGKTKDVTELIDCFNGVLDQASQLEIENQVHALSSLYDEWTEMVIKQTNPLSPQKLHLGCGRNIMDGWINLDVFQMDGVDVVADLDNCKNNPLPFDDNSINQFLGSHVIEHLNNTLDLMEELHRIAKPNAVALFRVPYGSNDDAFEDPTHVRQYFLNSFGYFSQPFFWRADYGYRGDWLTERIILIVDKQRYESKTTDEIMHDVNSYRNVVKEMIVELRAIKPIREPKRELQVSPYIEIILQ
jgi:SAM-dependent methyltransferase